MSNDVERKPEKVDLGDTPSLKRAIDETACDVIINSGYIEDHTVSNVKILLGTLTCGTALLGQFYPKKYPENFWLLLCCVIGYTILSTALNLYMTYQEGDTILFTRTRGGTAATVALKVISRLPRFSPQYELEIIPREFSTNKPAVKLLKSIEKYFDVHGVLAEHVVKQDVQKLLEDFENSKKDK